MKTVLFSIFLLFSFTNISADPINPAPDTPQGKTYHLLQGVWENIVSATELTETVREENVGPENAETAQLRYHFCSNGAFVRSIRHGSQYIEETGAWEISEDGASLLLHFAGKEAEQAAIRYIEADEMVLEQSPRMPGNAHQTETKQWFFSKV
ncbi:MAG: hypothetical protein KF852_14095 [Saprospiraceae bacterium]|nr:hypothetical protein [Saprospiraceae bacterium]